MPSAGAMLLTLGVVIRALCSVQDRTRLQACTYACSARHSTGVITLNLTEAEAAYLRAQLEVRAELDDDENSTAAQLLWKLEEAGS